MEVGWSLALVQQAAPGDGTVYTQVLRGTRVGGKVSIYGAGIPELRGQRDKAAIGI